LLKAKEIYVEQIGDPYFLYRSKLSKIKRELKAKLALENDEKIDL
jgi:hypothetical protein